MVYKEIEVTKEIFLEDVDVNSKNREQDLGTGMGQFCQGDKPTIDFRSATQTL